MFSHAKLNAFSLEIFHIITFLGSHVWNSHEMHSHAIWQFQDAKTEKKTYPPNDRFLIKI